MGRGGARVEPGCETEGWDGGTLARGDGCDNLTSARRRFARALDATQNLGALEVEFDDDSFADQGWPVRLFGHIGHTALQRLLALWAVDTQPYTDLMVRTCDHTGDDLQPALPRDFFHQAGPIMRGETGPLAAIGMDSRGRKTHHGSGPHQGERAGRAANE